MIFHTTSKKPVLLVGSGARSSGASELIYRFIQKTSIPVLTTMNAVDLVQDQYRLGFIGTYGNRVSNMIMNECDLIVSVGARLGLRQIGPHKELFAPRAKLIRVDIDQYELGRQIKEDEVKHQLDAKLFMQMLLEADVPFYHDWWNRCFAVKKLLEGYDDTEGNLCIDKIAQLLPENPVVTADVGQNGCWTAQSLWLKGTKGRILIGGGYGAMGCGLPFAIGASISTDNGLTFCITGDGGLLMNIQELEVLKREKLPIKIFVINNKALGKISEIQHVYYDNRYAQTNSTSGYTVPDFEKVALAYGIKAATLDSYHNLDEYREWMMDDKPCLLNIMIAEDTLLIPKIKWETSTVEPALNEDMHKRIAALISV